MLLFLGLLYRFTHAMNDKCVCPDDGRKVPSTERVTVFEPGAEVRDGRRITRDISKVHVFDKKCPVHGYTEIT